MGTKATEVFAVKRRNDGAWYGPSYGRHFGFGGLRVSMFDSPGKAKTVISRYSGGYNGAKPEDFAIMVIDLNQATEYVPN